MPEVTKKNIDYLSGIIFKSIEQIIYIRRVEFKFIFASERRKGGEKIIKLFQNSLTL